MARVRELTLFALVLILGLFLLGSVVFGWTNPSQTPPGGNVAAPLNTGGTTQTKTGGLNLGGNFNVTGTATLTADLSVGDQLTALGAGPHAVGGAAESHVRFLIKGNYSGTGGSDVIGLNTDGILTGQANTSIYGQNFATSFTEAGSGTHPLVAQVRIVGRTITDGSAATTDAASLYVSGPMAGATNNYAVWIDDGVIRFDNDIVFGSGGTRLVRTNTSDGSDSGVILVAGGGAGSASRGSYIQVGGNESGTLGTLYLYTGSAAGSSVRVITNNETLHAFVVEGDNGKIKFSSGLGTGTGGNYLCIDTGTYEVLRGNGSACTASSERFKTDIQNLGYGLAEVRALRPVEYYYIPEANMGSGKKIGFVAEEMHGVFPEVVTVDAEGRAFGLDYPVLTAVLAKAVQELDQKNELMEKEVKELREKIRILESR